MLNFRPTPLLLTALLSVSLSVSAQEEQTTADTVPGAEVQTIDSTAANGYIKDDLFIYVHSGAGKRFRILGSIVAGTPIEKLDGDSESGYIQVKDDKGRIGWIEASNFTTEPGIRIQLNQLQQKFDLLQKENEENQAARDQAVLELDSARQDAEAFGQSVAKLEQDKVALKAQIEQIESKQNRKTLLYGAGILFGGLVFGLLLPSMMPRRRRQDNWL